MSIPKRRWMVAILAGVIVLIGIVYFGLGSVVDTSERANRTAIRSMAHAVEEYHKKFGRYPTNEEGLDVLVTTEFLQPNPTDRWGRKYNYRYPSTRKEVPFEVWTFGADGVPGGTDENKDLGNWDR